MAAERVKLTFPPDLVNQPVIYNMGKQFGVVTNIRRANLSHDRGWMIVEVVGSESDVEKSLAWAREQGVRVEPVSGTEPGA
jgi:ABC-type methionine transport system ATPase subunit